MRKVLIVFAIAAASIVAAGLWLQHEWQRFESTPLNADRGMTLWLPAGTGFSGLVRQLEALGLAQPGLLWRAYGRLHQPALRAGEYRIPPGLAIGELIAQLEAGQVHEHRFTIVDGWTFARLRDELAADVRLRPEFADIEESELMARLGCEGCAAEGRFLPETYFFTRPASDRRILERAFEAMERTLDEVWAGRRDDLPLDSPEELLVLASIIERETGQASERARVAGVFVRRLEIGMRLQTDPTVAYGLGDDFDGRLRRVHLRTDHPWNTYTRHGLPPTPIALPGKRALKAAADPAPGTSLYFVSRGDGTHQFSDTLEEHNAAVNRYIRGIR